MLYFRDFYFSDHYNSYNRFINTVPDFRVSQYYTTNEQVTAQAHDHEQHIKCDDGSFRVVLKYFIFSKMFFDHTQSFFETEVESDVEIQFRSIGE